MNTHTLSQTLSIKILSSLLTLTLPIIVRAQEPRDIVVAIIDTGVDVNHPLIRNHLWTNPGELNTKKDNDGNGYAGDLHGWNFVSNNNKGTMNVGGSGNCPSFSSPIVWTVTKAGDFTLKITEGDKAKRVTQGYFLKMRNQTENSFELVDNVSVGGKSVDVVYQFSKQ